MSNVVAGIVRRRKVGSPTQKAVLLFMADCASDDGSGVWISKSHIADDLEMGRRTVQLAMASLVDAGLVREAGRRKRHNGYTVEYAINLGAVEALNSTRSEAEKPAQAPCAGDAHVQEPHMPCAGAAHQSVQEMHTNHPSTIHEPSEEPPLVPPPPKPPPKKRAVAIPENWTPSEKNIADARERNFTDEEIRHEAQQFRDYHVARGNTFKDWNAAWRNWLGNARKFNRGRGMAGNANTGLRGPGRSIASIAAWRRASGQS
jgi:hypothetical protein